MQHPGAGLIFLWLSVSLSVTAQTAVTFRLDLANLLEEELFIPSRGDRMFVRGDFNAWSGNGFELAPGPDSSLYSATFTLDATPGDTLFYKFVMAREGSRYFWEVQPDPSNPPDGNRALLVGNTAQELPVARFVHDEYFQFPVRFRLDKLVADFDTMRAWLERIHPALYDYTAKPDLDAAFDLARGQLRDSMEFRHYFNLLSRVMAQIGCGHSHLWIPRDYWNTVPDAMFPLRLYLGPDGAWVSGYDADDCGVPIGSQILAINGEPMESIVAQLEDYTAADGFNPSYKRYMTGKHFSRKYALVYGFPAEFRVRLKDPEEEKPREMVLHGIPDPETGRQAEKSNDLSFRILEKKNTAVFTIPTFGFYDRVDMFHAFVDSVFREISSRGTEHLILDLRGNAGGDPFCAAYLFSYLQHEPVPYFEEHYGKYDTLALPLPKPSGHFTGKLYTLIDGGGFSTTGHFCALLKYHGIGTFIGEETGATFTCTGSVMYPTLEQTRIILGTARNRRYTAAVKGMDPRRGVLPDHPVYLSPDDLKSGRDAAFEFALSLAE